MTERRIALTGHRPGKRLDTDAALHGMLLILLKYRDAEDDVTVLTGGADGADKLWWEASVIAGAPYELYAPRGYREHYKLGEWFDEMQSGASEIHWTQMPDKAYHWTLNFSRNADMVNGSTEGVVCTDVHPSALLKEERGGTKHGATLMMGRNKREDDYGVLWLNSLTGNVSKIWKTDANKPLKLW